MRIAIFLITFFLSLSMTYSSRELSKEEIRAYCILRESKYPSNYDYHMQLEKPMVDFINGLERNDIDTIGAYYINYPGVVHIDSTISYTDPWYGYIQWNDDGRTFNKSFTKIGDGPNLEIKRSIMIDFFADNYKQISNEIFIGITRMWVDKFGQVDSSTISMTFHSTEYRLYCRLGKISAFKKYDSFDLEDSNNPFMTDNYNLTTNKWRILIDDQVRKIKE